MPRVQAPVTKKSAASDSVSPRQGRTRAVLAVQSEPPSGLLYPSEMGSNLVQVNWESRKNILCTKLNSLRVKEIHTDITLSCDGENFPAHRLILTISCGYFARTFEANKENSPSFILVCGIQAPILQALLNFIYDGTTTIASEEVPELLKAGLMLEVPGLMEMGSNYLSAESNKEHRVPPSEPAIELKVSSMPEMDESKELGPKSPLNSPSSSGELKTGYLGNEGSASREAVKVECENRLVEKENGQYVTEAATAEVAAASSVRNVCKSVLKRKSDALTIEEIPLLFSDSADSDDSFSFEGWDNSDVDRKTHPLLMERKLDIAAHHLCQLCSNTFSSLEELKEHARTHETSPSSYSCEICGESFRSKRTHTLHQRSHQTGSKLSSKGRKMKREPEYFCPRSRNDSRDSCSSQELPPPPPPPTKAKLKVGQCSKVDSKVSHEPKRFKQEKDQLQDDYNSIDEILFSVAESFKSLSNGESPFLIDDSIYDSFNGHHSPDKGKPSEDDDPQNDPLAADNDSCSLGGQDVPKLVEWLKAKFSLNWINTRVCTYCDFEFLNTKHYRKHRASECKYVECRFCLKSFVGSEDRSSYERHLAGHRDELKPYQCSKCDFASDSVRSFEDHVCQHTGILPFWCLLCEFQCLEFAKLREHMSAKHRHIDSSILDYLT